MKTLKSISTLAVLTTFALFTSSVYAGKENSNGKGRGVKAEFGPTDIGYYGGRWWDDANENGYMDEEDVDFLCPLSEMKLHPNKCVISAGSSPDIEAY